MKLLLLINFLVEAGKAYEKEGLSTEDVDVLFGVEGDGYDISHYAAMHDEEGVKDPRLVFALAPLDEQEVVPAE